jgi:hypothetical protein
LHTILAIARNVIINQTKEIYFMKNLYINLKDTNSQFFMNNMLNKKNKKNTTNEPLMNNFKSDYPFIFQNLKCDESHFNINYHNMNDSEYVKHMIAHHNTALELSKLIIISTKNHQILVLAQIISLDQSKEIFELYFLEKSLNNHWRNSFTLLYMSNAHSHH